MPENTLRPKNSGGTNVLFPTSSWQACWNDWNKWSIQFRILTHNKLNVGSTHGVACVMPFRKATV